MAVPNSPCNPWQLRHAARVLAAGGVIVHPTEGVYGLGCRADAPAAVQHVARLKRRRLSKGLIVLVNSISEVESWLDLRRLNRTELEVPRSHPVTWVIPASRLAPDYLTGGQPGIAVRICGLGPIRALIKLVGPLVSTSANPSGRPAARTVTRARGYFPVGVDYFMPGKLGGAQGPTEIRDALTGRILRKGG
ncbi:MAG: L-threonylcarbamoyladenylate synthase [Gammaproteobacteria bacterium]|nr:L-threonylcarbamoyladenylate synthase [Gammaproteobacteria bacterium]